MSSLGNEVAKRLSNSIAFDARNGQLDHHHALEPNLQYPRDLLDSFVVQSLHQTLQSRFFDCLLIFPVFLDALDGLFRLTFRAVRRDIRSDIALDFDGRRDCGPSVYVGFVDILHIIIFNDLL